MKNLTSFLTVSGMYIASIFSGVGGKLSNAMQAAQALPSDTPPDEIIKFIEFIIALLGTFLAKIVIEFLKRKFPNFFRGKRYKF